MRGRRSEDLLYLRGRPRKELPIPETVENQLTKRKI